MNEKIVCLGWGSLIWDSRELNIPIENWKSDGPILPIEFTRISSDNRVTLIIDTDKETIQNPVLWGVLNASSLNEAVCLLATRESTSSNKVESASSEYEGDDPIKSVVATWLKSKEIRYAVWTGLKYKRANERPSVIEILAHLKGLSECDKNRAENYIRRAPKQITTPYRIAIEEKFGWTPLD